MPSKENIADAKERLDRVANVYWGTHSTMPRDHSSFKPDEIVWRVLADYALVGKVSVAKLIERAKQRVKELG